MISPRTRELGFLLPPAMVGFLGVATVATAQADRFRSGPWPAAVGVLAAFVAMHLALRRRAPMADPFLLPVIGLLTAIGLIQLQRIDASLAADQAVWVAAGALVFVAALLLLPDHHVLEDYRYLIGLAGVGLLVITAVFGTTINGSKLWIEVGGGQTVQLGELSKLLIAVFLAGYLRDKRELLAIPTRRLLGIPMPPMSALGPVLVVMVACLMLVGLLNDFGTGLLFFGLFLSMIYLATGRAAYAAIGGAFFLVGSVLIYALVPRIRDRVDGWLRPFEDAQGQGYQLVQSLYAMAEGGVVGPGLGKAFLVAQDGSRVIPALETDFIFTAVATELGYVGAVGLLLVFVVLLQRGFAIAAGATDGFSKLLAGGLTAVVGLQAFLIVGGVIRLVPLTGVTLPFLSYGGSSVVTNFAIAAILCTISHRSRAGAPPPRRRRAPAAVAPPEGAAG